MYCTRAFNLMTWNIIKIASDTKLCEQTENGKTYVVHSKFNQIYEKAPERLVICIEFIVLQNALTSTKFIVMHKKYFLSLTNVFNSSKVYPVC